MILSLDSIITSFSFIHLYAQSGMLNIIWTFAVVLAIAETLSIVSLHSSSTSTITGNSASTHVSGSSGGCSTGSASTSVANSPGGVIRNDSPTNIDECNSDNSAPRPGTSDSFSVGGTIQAALP